MTLEEQALKLYPPLSYYEKEPIEYNRLQAARREAWIRAKREDAAEIERLKLVMAEAMDPTLTPFEVRATIAGGLGWEGPTRDTAHQQQAANSEEGK